MDLHDKLHCLKNIIKVLGSLAVAYSGGVDSTFLLAVAVETLGGNAAGITVRSPAVPDREIGDSRRLAEEMGFRQIIADGDQLVIPEFTANPPDRCYICKRYILSIIKDVAEKEGFAYIAEGSNADDEGDYRPGMKAVHECNVLSPLKTAGLTKEEIRILSREMGLPTWDKPSYACLVSRIPYGELITKDKLLMVDKAEQLLREHGFGQLRVRAHGNLARIELMPEDIGRLFEGRLPVVVYSELKKIGFIYVTVDLTGYRTGSMNEVL